MRIYLFLCVFLYASAAHAAEYAVQGDLAGDTMTYILKEGETVFDITRASNTGYVELLAANPALDPEAPVAGTEIIIPKDHVLPSPPRKGIVINLAEMRLYYYPTPGRVFTYPVSVGRMGWETKTGSTWIVTKRKDPTWTPPPSIRAEDPTLPAFIPAGPNNPLGAYAMNLGWENYVLHGTNNPKSIGRRFSHGCIRLYPEDIEALFNMVDIGTKVTVVDEPFKLGWKGGILFLEVTPLQPNRDAAVAANRHMAPEDIPGMVEAITVLEQQGADINWSDVKQAAANHNGRPTPIGTRD